MLFFAGGAAFAMQDDFITVTLRSHITPSVYVDGFVPGKKFPVKLPCNTTVKGLIQKFFFQKEGHNGFVAVNGIASEVDTVLKEGDLVDLYSLIPGG
jgi:sulfur carrier protein ThiS